MEELPVGCHPDPVPVPGNVGEKALHHIPVPVHVEFVGVAPEVEQPGQTEERFPGAELLGQRHQLRVPVVAGGVPGEEIPRQVKSMGGSDRAGIADPGGPEHGEHPIVVQAEGIGVSPDGIRHQRLQRRAVLQDLPQRRGAAAGKRRVPDPVSRHLVVLVERGDFPGGDRRDVHVDAVQHHALLPAQQAGVQVEGTADAVPVHHLHQAAVLQHAVVIAQRQRSPLPSGKQHGMDP